MSQRLFLKLKALEEASNSERSAEEPCILTLRIKIAQKPYIAWSLSPKALVYESLESPRVSRGLVETPFPQAADQGTFTSEGSTNRRSSISKASYLWLVGFRV